MGYRRFEHVPGYGHFTIEAQAGSHRSYPLHRDEDILSFVKSSIHDSFHWSNKRATPSRLRREV